MKLVFPLPNGEELDLLGDGPVVSLCREDISDAGYDPEVSDDDFLQIVSRIGEYLEWQDFFPQFLENIREACAYLNIKALDDENE